jgi:hypothetical protein
MKIVMIISKLIRPEGNWMASGFLITTLMKSVAVLPYASVIVNVTVWAPGLV